MAPQPKFMENPYLAIRQMPSADRIKLAELALTAAKAVLRFQHGFYTVPRHVTEEAGLALIHWAGNHLKASIRKLLAHEPRSLRQRLVRPIQE